MGMKSTGQLSDMLGGRRTISRKFAEQLAGLFPEINPTFLYEESCTEMLRPVDSSTTGDFSRNVSSSINVSQNADLLAVVKKQQEQIDRLLAIIEKLTK